MHSLLVLFFYTSGQSYCEKIDKTQNEANMPAKSKKMEWLIRYWVVISETRNSVTLLNE